MIEDMIPSRKKYSQHGEYLGRIGAGLRIDAGGVASTEEQLASIEELDNMAVKIKDWLTT